MHILPPSPEHYDAWVKLWHGYQNFYEISLADEVARYTWERFLDANGPVHCALAVEGNQPIGFVHWIYHHSTWTHGQYCYLQDLYVAADRRSKGTGRRLIEHVYEHAAGQKAARVYWLTHKSNAPAIHLYDQVADDAGFIQYRKNMG